MCEPNLFLTIVTKYDHANQNRCKNVCEPKQSYNKGSIIYVEVVLHPMQPCQLFFFTYIPRTRVQKIWTPLWFGDTAIKNQNCFRNRQFSNVLYQDYWLLTVAGHNESSIALNSGDGRKPLCTLRMLMSILTVILTSVLCESDSGGHGIRSVIWCVARIWAGSRFQATSSVTE